MLFQPFQKINIYNIMNLQVVDVDKIYLQN